MNDNSELKGLGGWLVLVGFGVVVGPFGLVYEFGPLYYSIFTDGTFEYLTTPGTEVYHELWGTILIVEALYNSLMILAGFYLIYLFFSKHHLFPKAYIAITLVSIVLIPLDAWLVSFVIIDEPIFDSETAKEFTRALFAAVVWVPYMLLSKRVKATFLENMPNRSMQQDACKTDVSA